MPAVNLSRISACGGSLTNAKQIFPLTLNTSAEAFSELVADSCRLHKFEAELTVLAGGATSLIWNLAKDVDGNRALTPEVTSAIVPGATSTASGGVAAILDVDRKPLTGATSWVAGIVYLVARLNAGTCTFPKGLLYWVP